MSTLVVMITGALTGIGRATAPWPSLTKAPRLSSPAAATKRARRSPPNCARSVWKPTSSRARVLDPAKFK